MLVYSLHFFSAFSFCSISLVIMKMQIWIEAAWSKILNLFQRRRKSSTRWQLRIFGSCDQWSLFFQLKKNNFQNRDSSIAFFLRSFVFLSPAPSPPFHFLFVPPQLFFCFSFCRFFCFEKWQRKGRKMKSSKRRMILNLFRKVTAKLVKKIIEMCWNLYSASEIFANITEIQRMKRKKDRRKHHLLFAFDSFLLHKWNLLLVLTGVNWKWLHENYKNKWDWKKRQAIFNAAALAQIDTFLFFLVDENQSKVIVHLFIFWGGFRFESASKSIWWLVFFGIFPLENEIPKGKKAKKKKKFFLCGLKAMSKAETFSVRPLGSTSSVGPSIPQFLSPQTYKLNNVRKCSREYQ